MKNLKIKGKRNELGLTQTEMAKLLDIELCTYNLKEQGKRDFTIKEAIKMCKIFNCKFEDIFLIE